MPWYELVYLLIGVGIGWGSLLYVTWVRGWWGRILHVGPLLEKMAQDESTLLRYETEDTEKGMSLVELAELPKYQCVCCGAPPWEHESMGTCGRCRKMCDFHAS